MLNLSYYIQEIDSGNSLSTEDLVMRIIRNRSIYMERNRKKQLKELNNIKMMVWLKLWYIGSRYYTVNGEPLKSFIVPSQEIKFQMLV